MLAHSGSRSVKGVYILGGRYALDTVHSDLARVRHELRMRTNSLNSVRFLSISDNYPIVKFVIIEFTVKIFTQFLAHGNVEKYCFRICILMHLVRVCVCVVCAGSVPGVDCVCVCVCSGVCFSVSLLHIVNPSLQVVPSRCGQ